MTGPQNPWVNRFAGNFESTRSLKLPVILLLLLASNVFAEWYKDYESALDSIKKGRYADAIPKLQAALGEMAEEGTNIKFYGMKFGDYFPHYYLGKAYFYQQDYQAALSEFNRSAEQGEIQNKRDLFRNMSDLKSIAAAQISISEQNPAPPPVTQVVPKNEPSPQVVIPPAEKKPSEETQNTQESAKPAQQVAVKETPRQEVVVPPPQSPAEILKVKTQELLKEGAGRYFQGNYDGAIASFLQVLKLNPDDASSHFFLGCAYAAKYLLAGSQDELLMKSAGASFQRARKGNIESLLKNPYISPAILKIYEKS